MPMSVIFLMKSYCLLEAIILEAHLMAVLYATPAYEYVTHKHSSGLLLSEEFVTGNIQQRLLLYISRFVFNHYNFISSPKSSNNHPVT